MLPLTCCYEHKKSNDCQQKAAHDCGSSIPLFGLRTQDASPVYQDEQTTPKNIYYLLAISSLPVSILLINFD